MIRWIQDRKWLSSITLTLSTFLVFGGVDTILQGTNTLLLAAIFSLAVFSAIFYAPAAIALAIIGSILELVLNLQPVTSSLTLGLALYVVAAFGSQQTSRIALIASIGVGSAVVWANTMNSSVGADLYGLILSTEQAKISAFIFMLGSLITANLLFWNAGRLAITNIVHVGTEFDRTIASETQAKLALEVAEQNERFQIARDINELIIQKITAVISQAEGGKYAAQADINSAIRSLDRVVQSAKSAHSELRRLYDMLNKSHELSAAPPSIDDLQQLVILYRELGFSVSLRHDGHRFAISEGADLAIYRIIFDAFENVRKHCQVGTSISLDFSWVKDGLQVLVKDNGIEFANRSATPFGEALPDYNADEDLKSLVEPIKGPGLTAMRERAALYGGSVEATRVPGVGFTISVIFPNLRTHPEV
ncbi:ATP-binding protein [Rhodoluna sp.]|uniref:sensor histidine kinase n=1 Tax=Rhodoluna sp. TaxID=1969481 RepID=UPI0025EA832A|nr:ATP-binding protein [Rhodoluna sp.]